MISIILLIIFVLINIVLAKVDADRINQNKPINHIVNALIYLALLFIVFISTYDWSLIIGLTLIRIPIFNTFLNYFRGKELTYISNTTTSVIDQITNFIPREIGYWNYCFWLTVISLILVLI
jgi:hypothetical protein